jgi:uroporphyrinogen decarboxylase
MEIQTYTKPMIDILRRNGSCMLASVHTIMPDVPPENILAMVDAAAEFGKY